MANKRINMINGHEILIDDNDRIADDSIQSLKGVTAGTGLASRAAVNELSVIGQSTMIGAYVAHYVPNMANVTDGQGHSTIGNVTALYSFACDHYNSYMKNSGSYMKTMDASGASSI